MFRNDVRVRLRAERSDVGEPMPILPNRSQHRPVSLRWTHRLLAVSIALLGCVAGSLAGWQTAGSAARLSHGVAGNRVDFRARPTTVDLALVLAVDTSLS